MCDRTDLGAVVRAEVDGDRVRVERLPDTTPAVEKIASAAARPPIRLVEWLPFPWNVIGCATVACGDLVVEDVLICAIGTAAFALVKRPAGMTEREWGQLGDAALALVRQADPGALDGTADLFGPGR
jgi:hypothetical protein